MKRGAKEQMRPFIMKINLNKGTGTTFQIELREDPNSYYDYEINWNYGGGDLLDNWVRVTNGNAISMDYESFNPLEPFRNIAIRGEFYGFQMVNSSTKDKLVEIVQWGDIEWGWFVSSFSGINGLNVSAKDVPIFTNVSSLQGMFNNSVGVTVNSNHWNLSPINNIRDMFANTGANPDIEDWDVSNILNMNGLFWYNAGFDRNLWNWGFNKNVSLANFIKADSMSTANANFLIRNLAQRLVGTGRTTQKRVNFQNLSITGSEAVDAYNQFVNDGWTITGVDII